MPHTTKTKLLEEEVNRLRRRVIALERQQRHRPHFTSSIVGNAAAGQSREGAVVVRDMHECGQADDELRVDGQLYFDLYDDAPDMFAFVDAATGRIVNCNNTLSVAIGYSKNEILAMPHISYLYHPDSEEARKEVFGAFLTTGSVRDVELQLLRQDGTAIDVSLSLSAVRDDKGKILHSRSIWRDITQRKQAEDALRQSHLELERRVKERTGQLTEVNEHLRKEIEARRTAEEALRQSEAEFRLLANIVPALFSYVGVDGCYRFINRRYEEWFGISAAEIVGKHYREILGDSVDEKIKDYIEAALSGERVEYEVELPYRQGGTRWVNAIYVPDKIDGEVHGLFALVTDVTGRKRTEQELKLSAEIMENMDEGVCLVRASDGCLVFTNPRFDEIFGYEAGELIGRHSAILNVPGEKTPQETAAEILRKLEETGIWSGNVHNIRKDETPFWTHANVSTFEHPQYGTVRVAVVDDVTDRKRAEESLRQDQEKLAHVVRLSTMGEMATGLAHELNQPLAAISNYCYAGEQALAGTEPADPEQLRELFEKSTGQAMRAGEIIRRLRGLVGKTNRVRSSVDVQKVIQEVLCLLESDLRQSEVRVEQQTDHSDHVAVVDEIQIQQVLLNLIRNALDAMSKTERDQRTLRITTSRSADDSIEVAVRDTGKGIPVELADQIFDAFFTTKSDGMGMGLAISRTIIESHGGRLWMTINSDRGVTFHITLPTAKERSDDDGP